MGISRRSVRTGKRPHRYPHCVFTLESSLRAYRHLYLLGKDNKLKHIDLVGSITSSSAGSLVEIYLQRLGSNGGLDEIVDAIPARKLITYWPASMNEWSTKAVRDAFCSSPLLPRLINLESIKRTIAAGVTDGLIGYAVKDSSGRLKLQKLKESLFDADVEISEDVYILKADEAQKLREPPRLAHLVVRPEHVVVKPGDKASFSYSGLDQYGQPIMVAEVEWAATGGSIDSKGMFVAGTDGGAFTAIAKADGNEAIAEVRIATKDEIPEIVETSGPRTIRWSGNVPPQKWMQFYTKVLSNCHDHLTTIGSIRDNNRVILHLRSFARPYSPGGPSYEISGRYSIFIILVCHAHANDRDSSGSEGRSQCRCRKDSNIHSGVRHVDRTLQRY